MYRKNFRQYWREHLAHLAVGYLIGVTPLGIPLAMLVCTRQAMEYVRSRDVAQEGGHIAGKDTPGIDLAYHVGGAAAGVVTQVGLAFYVASLVL